MSEQHRSAPSHLVDFSSAQHDPVMACQRRMQFGDITLSRGTLRPNPGIYIGAEQVIVTRHCGSPLRLEWRAPDTDALRSKLIVRGMVNIKPAGQLFWQRWSLPAEVFVVAFNRSYFTKLCSEASGPHFEPVGEIGLNDRKLSELIALFDQELLDNGANGRAYVESLGAALAVYLTKRKANKARDVIAPNVGLAPARLRQALEYIDAHLVDDVGLTELADVSGLNSDHFAHAFKAATGLPPHRYIVEQRIGKALTLLEQMNQSIADIALDCGFSNQSHFTHHFRRITGTTPAKYRRDLR